MTEQEIKRKAYLKKYREEHREQNREYCRWYYRAVIVPNRKKQDLVGSEPKG